jgi:hypothetical protein
MKEISHKRIFQGKEEFRNLVQLSEQKKIKIMEGNLSWIRFIWLHLLLILSNDRQFMKERSVLNGKNPKSGGKMELTKS